MGSRYACGFSLLELLVVLVITGIIGASVSVFIQGSIQSYVDQSRRAELVDLAEMTMQRMTRDIRRALPNSVRINNSGTILELLNVKDVARYRAGPMSGPGGGNPDRRLQFNREDTAFNVASPGQLDIAATDRLVIYHLGDDQNGGSAYAGDAVVTPDSANPSIVDDPDVADEYRITLASPGHQFAFESPTQRIYVVDTPTAYLCNPVAGTLRRQTNYTIQSSMPEDATAGALIASRVSQCAFSYDPGTATRNAVVTLQLTVSRSGEAVSLTRQVQVVNTP